MVEIAGRTTVADWYNLEKNIRSKFEDVDLWNEAFDIFEKRLNER